MAKLVIVIVIGNSIVDYDYDYDYDYIDIRINNDKRCLLYLQTVVTIFAYTIFSSSSPSFPLPGYSSKAYRVL